MIWDQILWNFWIIKLATACEGARIHEIFIWLIWQPCKYGPFQTFETDILGHHHCRLSGLNVPALPQETMAPRKDKTLRATISHNSPVYLKSVSNFKATLRRRESQRFIKREQVRIHSATSSTQIASAKFIFSNSFPRWDKEQWDREQITKKT